jgi:hypothetical protein
LSVARWSLRTNEADLALPVEEVRVLLLLVRRRPLLLAGGGVEVEGGWSSSSGWGRPRAARIWKKRAKAWWHWR